MELIKSETKSNVFLITLREIIIQTSDINKLMSKLDEIISIIVDCADSDDDNIRSLVSICLGKLLSRLSNEGLINNVYNMLESNNINIKSTAISSIR